MNERVEIRLARFAGRTAVNVRFGLSKLGGEVATRLNPFGCGRTGRGYAFHDHDVPKNQMLDSSQQAKVWVFDERTRKYIPYDRRLHGKYEELNLPVGSVVTRAPQTCGKRAIHRHDGDKHFGVIEYREE